MRPLQAQNPGPSVAWQKCFSTSGSDWFSGAVEDPKGGYFSAAYFEKTDYFLDGQNDSGLFLVKFDVNFNVIWKRGIPMFATKIIVEASGEILLGGKARRADDPTGIFSNFHEPINDMYGSDLALLKLDSTGQNILWARAYGSSADEDQMFDLIPAGNGYIFSGITRGANGDIPIPPCYNGFFEDAVFMKVDSVGNLQWVKTYGGSGTDLAAGSIVKLSENSFNLFVRSNSSDCDFAGTEPFDFDNKKNFRILSVIVDSAGNELKRKIDDSGKLTLYFAKNWVEGNKLYGVGTNYGHVAYSPISPHHEKGEGSVVEFDEDLNVYRQKLFGGNGDDFFFDQIADAQGNHIFFGATTTTDGSRDIQDYKGGISDYWLLKTDSNFNTIWSRTVGSNGVDTWRTFNYPFNKMFLRGSELVLIFEILPPPVIPNGNITCGLYVLVDNDSTRPRSDAWIIAFDLTTGMESSKKEITSYQIFPNPSNGIITVKNNKATSRDLKLKVNSQEGKELKELRYQDQENYSFSVEDLPDGIYYISIFRGRKLECTEKVVLRR